MEKSSVISAEYLNCGICLQLATAATETSCCHNLYCESCITDCKTSNKGCPSCRKPKFEAPASYLARRMINTIPVQCPHDCGATVVRGDLEHHKKKCCNRTYSCPNKGCGFKGTSEDYSNHIAKAHFEDLIEAFEAFELKKKYTKKGKISGYYVQGGQHPIEGTFKMENGKLVIHTEDTVGLAKWEGSIDKDSLTVKIIKQYNGAHAVVYTGRINEDLSVIEGQWNIGGYGDDFKLVLTEEVELKKVVKKGKMSGYYVQGGQNPIEGTFSLENGKLTFHTEDTVGLAKWEGTIEDSLSVKIIKHYNGKHKVTYAGKINKELNVIEGKWSMVGLSDDFKLALIEESELKKVSKKGTVSGYYVQGGQHPIEGTFTMENGKLTIQTEDTVGLAQWEGDIEQDLSVKIIKQYNGAHAVVYTGKINEECNVIEGRWDIDGYGDDFKLTFTEESE